MSISAYNASLTIPPYPGLVTRTTEAKPSPRDTTRNDPQPGQTAAASDRSVPSTGLLNTVV